jgi:hypothetical protein
MKEVLNNSFDRATNIELYLGEVSSSEDTTQFMSSRFFGASALDPDIKELARQATIYDNTVVPYTDVQPSLRKFSELTAKINKTVTGSRLFNIVDTDTLNIQNNTNNILSSGNVTTMRNVSSTGGTTRTNFPNSELVYFNGIVDNKGDYEKVVIKGFSNWNAVSREKRIGSGRKDSINLTPIFSESAYFGSDVNGTHIIRDLVKFRIQAVNTDGPGSGEWMVFRAYLTDLSDNVDATWNEVKYAGRGDKFWIYDSFTRKISISFKVAALSAQEMKPMYQKLNFLMSNLMPDYKGVLMRGPLVRLMVGNYIDSQLGILNSLSYKIPQDSPWEIAIDEPEGGTKQLILPHVVEVTLGFTPIGSDTAGANKLAEKSTTTSHIAQNNTGDTQFQYIQ